LHKHHPDLRDVWGDLAKDIPIIEPKKDDQPANLKLTLLPFQRESLYWMRQQEKGLWHGGMLAVSMILSLIRGINNLIHAFQDEMGYIQHLPSFSCY